MIGVFFIPESPRYLLANGRDQEALDFLVKYHGNGNTDSKLVALEIQEMRDNIALDGIDKRPLDCKCNQILIEPLTNGLICLEIQIAPCSSPTTDAGE
jgi:hypothetical protein